MAGKGRDVDGCAGCAKWCLIIFNVLFCLIGIGLVAAGVYAYVALKSYLDIVGNPMINAPAIVIISFGCITFLIAAIGCIGACKESSCLLYTFAVIIGILLIAEIAAGAVAFHYRTQIEDLIRNNSVKLMASYNESVDNVAKDAWDTLQMELECCGVNSSADWTDLNIAPSQGGKIPSSCGTNTDGCLTKAIEFVENNIVVVGGVAIGFGVIEILGIILACCVGCNVNRSK